MIYSSILVSWIADYLLETFKRIDPDYFQGRSTYLVDLVLYETHCTFTMKWYWQNNIVPYFSDYNVGYDRLHEILAEAIAKTSEETNA